MKIVVCIKQVPSGQDVKIDENTGLLMRAGYETRMNPYDAVAIEIALRISEDTKADVTAVTMGPEQAELVIREAYAMGIENGLLVSDNAFVGSDVYCTSYTLMQAILYIGDVDLVICGKQSTDGDTAQTGSALAAHLGWPCLSLVQDIKCNDGKIRVRQRLTDIERIVEAELPCVVAVDRDICIPRIPSLRHRINAGKKSICRCGLKDMNDTDGSHYGVIGSPTRVVKVYSPEFRQKGILVEGGIREKTEKIADEIKRHMA